MNKFAEHIGLEKIAFDEAKDLFHKAAEALGIDMSSLENLLAETDSTAAIDKIASELGIHPEITAIILSDVLADVSRETIEKTASEKNVDPVELAYGVVDSSFVPGEISKIACATLVNFAKKGDMKLPLEKNAEAIGASKSDINVTAVAVELSSEGHSPELLKQAADDAGIDFRKLATQIIEGENWASEKIATAALNSEMMKKIAESDKIPEGFFVGVMSAIDKLAEEFHPKGIANLFGLKKEASTEGKDLDLEVHSLMKVGAQLSGFGPESLQFLYSYYSPEYALDKHASVAEKGHEDMAKIAMVTIGRIGALVSSNKLEIPESIGETIDKIAEIFKEKPEQSMQRLHITNSMLAGIHPANIKEAGEANGGIDKMSEAIAMEAIRQDEHEKIAGAQFEPEFEDEEEGVEKYASFPYSYAELLELEKDAGLKESIGKGMKSTGDFFKKHWSKASKAAVGLGEKVTGGVKSVGEKAKGFGKGFYGTGGLVGKSSTGGFRSKYPASFIAGVKAPPINYGYVDEIVKRVKANKPQAIATAGVGALGIGGAGYGALHKKKDKK